MASFFVLRGLKKTMESARTGGVIYTFGKA